MGNLVPKRKTWRHRAWKVMEFGLLITDVPIYISCKFVMYIFKIALVISENVRITFFNVLCIYTVDSEMFENLIFANIREFVAS